MSVWRPSTTGVLIGGVVVVILAAAVAFMLTHFQPRTEVKIGTGTFQARLARDQASREVGLAGVTELKANDAMLFVFPKDDTWGIWMKDMKVSIDIVWLDQSKKVVHIVKNASPDESTTKIFTPNQAARYVIELPVGSVQKYGVTVGSEASFTVMEAES
jgi:uncharacterized membrane protein (UPF0127 family)